MAKCSVMRITNRNTEVLGNIRIGDHVLDEINELKDLGVIFKNDLSFTNHITGVITKAMQRRFLLHNYFLTKDTNFNNGVQNLCATNFELLFTDLVPSSLP